MALKDGFAAFLRDGIRNANAPHAEFEDLENGIFATSENGIARIEWAGGGCDFSKEKTPLQGLYGVRRDDIIKVCNRARATVKDGGADGYQAASKARRGTGGSAMKKAVGQTIDLAAFALMSDEEKLVALKGMIAKADEEKEAKRKAIEEKIAAHEAAIEKLNEELAALEG